MTQSIVFPELDHTLKLQEGVLIVPKQLQLPFDYLLVKNFLDDKPVKLEFCSGNGQWIVSRAENDQNSNWIAVEMRFDRLKKIWKKGKRLALTNLLCIYGEAYRSTKHLIATASIDEIFINFPDPWPKRRHSKNRLIQKSFLDEIHRILKQDGTITFVTDDDNYANETKKEFLRHIGFKSVAGEHENYGSSFFNSLWLDKGKTIYYQTFQRVFMPTIIKLPSGMQSTLDWSNELEKAKKAESIMWQFDFDTMLPLDDEAQLASLYIALDHFKDTLLPLFLDKTKGAILFKGVLGKYEKNYQDWLTDRLLEDSEFSALLHSRDIFLDFLKLLMCALPVEVDPYICLDVSSLTLKEKLLFIAYEPLWDFKVALKGAPASFSPYIWKEDEQVIISSSQTAKEAILIPTLLSDAYLKKFEKKQMECAHKPLRLCFEDRFNMQWDGLENLFIDQESLSPIGRRMLQGFVAAGGNLVDF